MATDFPRTYEQWRHCITVDCGIDLTASFIDTRLQELGNPSNSQTAQFTKLYGDHYLNQVIKWFELARSEHATG